MTEFEQNIEAAFNMLKTYYKVNDFFSLSEVRKSAEEICNLPKFKEYKNLLVDKITDKYADNYFTKGYEPDVLALDAKDTEWFIKAKETLPTPYFDRYAKYLSNQNYADDIVLKIKKSTEMILSQCADPDNKITVTLKKRGLVIGDVQSGKTANYLALINLACDYGYRLIVLLAGMTEYLRKQTQKRVDYGFVGALSETIGSSDIEFIGVGKDDKNYYSVPYTNGQYDFNKTVKESNNSSITDYNKPVILVVKKNGSVLDHVIEALKAKEGNFKDRRNVLIIDDEADNASINTKLDESPTKINECIRSILNNYSIASYVGFTATPYANVFINSEDTEAKRELFPSDFIVQLNAPNNYFGWKQVFGSKNKIRIIDENEVNFLPAKHKKDYHYTGLCDSLIEAINSFIINNALRTLDGFGREHRSMLINISVSNAVQGEIERHVSDYVEKLRIIFDQDGLKDTYELIKNNYAKNIYNLYTTAEFYKTSRQTYDWKLIQKNILYELNKIVSIIFNSLNTDKFNYDSYTNGARVIAIGGYVLSRGLTLEGLMVSYYNRNSNYYDTMLQMCRWFGYRPKYEYLCRVYMTEQNKCDFIDVLDATMDLREQFFQMKIRGKTPKEFGLMIKESPNRPETKLFISARNKLKHSQIIEITLNYSGVMANTSKLFVDKNINDKNRQLVDSLINKLEEDGHHVEELRGRYIIKNVPQKDIGLFISKLKVSYKNSKFDTESLSDCILTGELHNWDIVFASGLDSDKKYKRGNFEIKTPMRSFVYEENSKILRISGSNNQLVDPGIFNAGLSLKQIEKARNNAEFLYNSGLRDSKAIITKDYLNIEGRNPLLVIFPLYIKAKDPLNSAAKEIEVRYQDELVYGFAIGFPGSVSKARVKYRVNITKLKEMQSEGIDLEEEEEDD